MYLGVEEGIYSLMDGLKMNINKPSLLPFPLLNIRLMLKVY